MKKPNDIDMKRSMDIRKSSKRGEHISKKDHLWNQKLYERYPDWYNATEARVFNETVPFGSNVRIKEPLLD